MMSRYLPIALFALLAGVIGFYLLAIGDGRKSAREIPSALIDQPVPKFSLPAVAGVDRPGLSSVDLGTGSAEGSGPALVNVFASWCVPCRAEHPILMRLAADGIPVHGINYKDKAADAAGWLAALGNPYRRIGWDFKGRTSIDWGVYGVPETFIIDKHGRIRYRLAGPITPATLNQDILPILRRLAE